MFTVSLYLDIKLYHIRLTTNLRYCLMILLPRVKYKHKQLSMGSCNYLEIFSTK